MLFAGMRVVIRDMGWLATKVETNALGNDMDNARILAHFRIPALT